MYYRADFIAIFDISKQLWQKSCLESITATKAEDSIRLLYKSCVYFHTLSVICGLLYITTSFLAEGQQLPFSGYTPTSDLYMFVFICDFFIIVLMANVVVNTDVFLAGLCYSFVLQFRILCYEIESLADLRRKENHEYVKKIRHFVRRHTFLLQYTTTTTKFGAIEVINVCFSWCGRMKRISKNFFLLQLCLAITSTVSEFYFLSERYEYIKCNSKNS